MYHNVSATMKDLQIDYAISDSKVAFTDYISHTRSIIGQRRPDLQETNINANLILDTNSPYELYPSQPIYAGKRLKYGVLLIHGLLDSPFSLRDIGERLQANGMLCRAILLPGHGTTPGDLMSVSYHDWIQSVRYGIETLKKEVDQIYLIGYSTGATLSIYHALREANIAGIILLAPAIRIKAPVDIMVGWHYFTKRFGNKQQWLSSEEEIDYAKYLSITFNAVAQVASLTNVIRELRKEQSLTCPMFMAVSHEDETISSHRAIDFFSTLKNPENKLLLYTSYNHAYPDTRILTRQTNHPQLNIKHFSHVSLPFSPDNSHYGQNGDFTYASRRDADNLIFGAYNRIEVTVYEFLHKMKVITQKRRELTYNPDFDFMVKEIEQFIQNPQK